MDRDGVEKHVKAIINGSEDQAIQHVSLVDSKGGLLVDRQECTNNLNWERTKAETTEIQERVRDISEHTNRLREQIDATRKLLEAKRAANAQRKSDLSSATYGIESRRANELDKVQQKIKRLDYNADKMHHDTIDLRMQLCTTAAKLAGLKMQRRKTRDGSIKEVFNIGPGSRLRIHDLRDLNGMALTIAQYGDILTFAQMYLQMVCPPPWLRWLSSLSALRPTWGSVSRPKLHFPIVTIHNRLSLVRHPRTKERRYLFLGRRLHIHQMPAQRPLARWRHACTYLNPVHYSSTDH